MGALAYLCDDTRGDWDASPGGNVYTVVVGDKDQFLTHNDGGTRLYLADKSHSACLKRVKAVQAFHMGSSRGWSDIGYNTLVCPHGRLIEGRGVLAVGAQCPGYNRSGIGSQMMNGGADPLTDAMANRQRKFYDDLYQIRKEAQRKMGHRDGVSTDCPGDKAYAWVKAGMPYLGNTGAPAPVPVPPIVIPKPVPKPGGTAPGPHHKFPLPDGYNFAVDDKSRYTVSGYYGRVFAGRTDRSWIQEFGSQMSRRGWNVGKGKTWLPSSGNNGYYGKEYAALVTRFQKSANLTEDGRLGPKTWFAAFESPVT